MGSRPPVAKHAHPHIAAGRVIAGKFRLTRQLGQGGMGLVWAAVHETLGREVAVKFLHPQTGANPVLADRFVSEAHMVAAIKHRFVVDVFDYGVTEDGLHYMVLELLHGSSLAERMDHGPSLRVRQAVRLMADCMRGLHVVHEAGIIHRDLKPDNIFVIEDADGAFPKLIDFGISRRTEASLKLDPAHRSSRLTQPGTVLGTPYYMSPEQLRGKHNIDRRADIYSAGVILYELLVGRLPFIQDNVGDLMVAITVTGAPSLRETRPELGAPLAAVIQRALAATPEQRYSTALELREALLALLPGLPSGAKCAVQLANPGEFTLSENRSPSLTPEPTLSQHSSLPAPLVSLSEPPPTGRSLPQLSRRLWFGLASALVLMLLVWTLTRELVPSLPAQPHASAGDTHATWSGGRAPEPAVAAPAVVPVPLAASAAQPGAAGSAAPLGAAGKSQRLRTRPRDPGPQLRPGQPDRPQKLYKKLDF